MSQINQQADLPEKLQSASSVSLPREDQETSSDPWNDEVLSLWLERQPAATSLDQWIYWNNSPLRHASTETLTSFFPASFCSMFTSDVRVRTHVDALLRAKLSWSATVSWAPHDPLWDLAMIPPHQFKRLALLSASFSMQREIARSIDGSVVRQLRKQLGEDIFQFVLLSNSSSKYFLEPMNAELSALNDVAAAINQGAVTLVQHAFSSKERGIQERIAAKLSGCFAQGYCDVPLPWASQAEQIVSALWKETSSWL